MTVKNATKQRSALRLAVDLALATAGISQRELAARMDVSPTTLSSWLVGAHPGPSNLVSNIERALHLPEGGISSVIE